MALPLAGEWDCQGLRILVIDADRQNQIKNYRLDRSEQREREGLPRLFDVVGLASDTLHREAPEIARTVNHIVIDAPLPVVARTHSTLLTDGRRDAARAARESFQSAGSWVR